MALNEDVFKVNTMHKQTAAIIDCHDTEALFLARWSSF
jgi:hypothetical protein